MGTSHNSRESGGRRPSCGAPAFGPATRIPSPSRGHPRTLVPEVSSFPIRYRTGEVRLDELRTAPAFVPGNGEEALVHPQVAEALVAAIDCAGDRRSEERRVGKECRRWRATHY